MRNTVEFKASNGSPVLPLVLLAVFLTLKLTGTVAWSWWWVLAPLWVPAVLTGVIVVAGVAIASRR